MKPDDYSDEFQIKLTVNRETWRRVQNLKDSGQDARHYVVEVNRQGDATVRFGDGVRGRRPPAGSKIAATYRFGGAAAGNVGKRRNVICFSLN